MRMQMSVNYAVLNVHLIAGASNPRNTLHVHNALTILKIHSLSISHKRFSIAQNVIAIVRPLATHP